MNKILIIIAREFSTRVRKKSFIILTVLTPFLMVALVAVPLLLASIKDDTEKLVRVVDATGNYAPLFQDTETYRFVPTQKDDAAFYAEEGDSLPEAVVIITGDLATEGAGGVVAIHSRRTVPAELLQLVRNTLTEEVHRQKLAATGIPEIEKILEEATKDVKILTVQRTAEGEAQESSTDIAMGAGFLLCFLIYIFVMSYGGMVMQSVTEEKTGRIFEIIVGSVKPFQLMMGKIVGIALVGLVQLLIWGVMLAVLLGVVGLIFGPDATAAASTAPAMMETGMPMPADETGNLFAMLMNLPFVEMSVLFLLYFVFGYLLYASIFAAAGASVDNAEDSSQFMMPMILIMLFALYAGIYSIENTNGPLAFWASMVPFTSPITMMVRIPFGVPLWEELLSLGILIATSLLLTWIAGRIYRIGILMYGKKPSWKELWRWARQN